MSRFKRATAAVLAGAMSVSLAACGSSTDGSASSGSAAASGSSAAASTTTASSGSSDGKTVINVWSNDRHDEEYVTKMVDQYNQTNTDNIEINLTIITDNYDNMIQMAVNGGSNAPDIHRQPVHSSYKLG